MRPSIHRLSSAELSEHAGFLRALARGLASCEHTAEDLTQEAWLTALSRPPRRESALRSWLARVLRSRAVDDHRARAVRVLHEEAAARAGETASPAELGRRLEVQNLLGQSVQDLEEPYRTAIYMRYFEGLPPRRIAAALEVPVDTVKTRLHRGLATLRQRLDESHDGNRSTWLGALAPLHAPSLLRRIGMGPTGGALLGGSLLKLKLVLVAGALAVAASLVYTGGADDATSSPASALTAREPAALVAPPAVDPILPTAPTAPEASRSEVAAGPGREAEEVWRGFRIVGTVSGDRDLPIAGAEVSATLMFAGETHFAVTDERGDYAIDFPLPTHYSARAGCSLGVTASGPQHRTGIEARQVDLASAGLGSEHRLDFRLHPAHVLRGTLMDGSGNPAADEPVAAVNPDGAILASAHTDARGRFEFAWDQPRRTWIAAGRGELGYAHAGPFSVLGEEVLEIPALTLRPRATLEGRIEYPDGSPLRTGSFQFERTDGGDSLMPHEWWLAGRSPAVPPEGLDIQGFSVGYGKTDEDGRFALVGLAPGAYSLTVLSGAPRTGAPSAGPFFTGEYANVVTQTHRLVVHVRDTEGLHVGEAFVEALPLDPPGAPLPGGTIGLRSWSTPVRPGLWRVSASRTGALPAEAEIEILPEQHHTELDLVLDFSFVGGQLRFTIADEDGRRIDGCFLDLCTADGSSVVQRQRTPESDGVLPDVPPGSYELWITPGRDWYDPWFQARVPAVVSAGETTEVNVSVRTGGWIEFRFEGSREDLDTPLRVTLLAAGQQEGARVDELLQLTDHPGWGRMGKNVPTAIGARGRTELLAPGLYAARIEAQGRAASTREVSVRARETSVVSIDFSAD